MMSSNSTFRKNITVDYPQGFCYSFVFIGSTRLYQASKDSKDKTDSLMFDVDQGIIWAEASIQLMDFTSTLIK